MCCFAAQLNFDIAPETFLLAKQMVSDGLLKYLSPERIWQEILKALQTNNFELFITAAQQCGALQQILPEIVSLFSIPENIEKHPEETVGAHTILALKEVSQSKPIVKFAVLVHDIGKIKTPKENISTYDDHALNGIDIINQICNRLRIPNTYKKFAILCCQYHTLFSKIKKFDSNTLIEFADRFVKCEINDFIEVCKANYFGRLLKYDQEEFQENVEMFKLIVETLKKIKASNIPNFNNIKKDKNIANELHKLKIDTINNLLKK
jgi:tRNA nucleotidyltransferase (CCA-adding enzyme)